MIEKWNRIFDDVLHIVIIAILPLFLIEWLYDV